MNKGSPEYQSPVESAVNAAGEAFINLPGDLKAAGGRGIDFLRMLATGEER